MNRMKKDEYGSIVRILTVILIIALTALVLLAAVFIIASAVSNGDSDDGSKVNIITGTDTAETDTETSAVMETEPPDQSGLVYPGNETEPEPVDVLPITEPPATEPPATEPPATEPPTTEPPATEPPVTEPHIGEPEQVVLPSSVDLTDDTLAIPRYLGLAGIENEFPGTVLTATEDKGQEYVDKIVFLGDSLTYGLQVYGVLSGGRSTTQVWTPSNHTLLLSGVADKYIFYPETGTELTVREAIRTKKPAILMISLGINGIAYLTEDNFAAELNSLIGAVKRESPDTVIILQSMFPVTATYQYQGSINNNKIRRGNYWMAKTAAANNVYYLNTAEMLVGNDGYLSSEMQSGDGLHIGTAAYNIILSYIRTHAVP